MAKKTHYVTFEPGGQRREAPDGSTVLEAAQAAGVHLNAPCGGTGLCGGCRIIIPDDPPEPTENCRRILTGEEIGRNLRLACQVRVRRDLRVVIPEETRLGDQKILTEGVGRPVALEPNARKVAVHLPAPSLADQRADAERLLDALAERGLEDLTVETAVLRTLPQRLRKLEFHAAAVVLGDRVIQVERPTGDEACYGLAVDIGTTTVVGYLVDLVTGRTAAVASRANPQTAYGDDVVARIEYCGHRKEGLKRLHDLVIGAINDILAEACRHAHVKPSAIYELCAVGNTTMNHLLLALPVDTIARAPFVPASAGPQWVLARGLGLRTHPRSRLYTAPLVGGFVGADTVAVILATGMHESPDLALAIDIGTNGEIVLGNRERLLACSTAAGPAFEGARIRYGMRAASGAIDRVDLDGGQLVLHTIDDSPPVGLCGTGLIDAVAALLEADVLKPNGTMRSPEELRQRRSALADRVIRTDSETAVVLASDGRTGLEHPILLTQRDVREVQLAKGAIAAGIQVLLDLYGARVADVKTIYLAGAFGNMIRPDRARAIGLVPEVSPERVRFVGNAAGAGARMLLVNRPLRQVAEDVARGIEHVELGQQPQFQTHFADAMFFPAPQPTGT